MSNQVITFEGAQRYANALTDKRKFTIKGFQVSEGNASTSDDMATMMNATALNYDNPSQLHPDVGEYYLLTEEFPVEDPSIPWTSTTTYSIEERVRYGDFIYESLQNSNLNKIPPNETTWWKNVGTGNWYIEFGLTLSPVTVGNEYFAKEIGLWAEEKAVPTAWSGAATYQENIDYVSHTPVTELKYYKSEADTPNTWVVSTSYDTDDIVHYNSAGWISLTDSNVGNIPGASPSNWASHSIEPGKDNGVYWLEVSATIDTIPLITLPSTVNNPNPFLLYYIVRQEYPLPVTNTHATIWRIKLGLTQQQSVLTVPAFNQEDIEGFHEAQLAMIESITNYNTEVRALAMEVEALREAIP